MVVHDDLGNRTRLVVFGMGELEFPPQPTRGAPAMSTIPNDPASDHSVESPTEAPARRSRLGRGLAGLVGMSQFGPTEE